jgi:hypothetical protein
MGSPNCVDSICYDGNAGDPCNFDSNCGVDAPFCENLNNTCSDGMPGATCSVNTDCLSNMCAMEVCL